MNENARILFIDRNKLLDIDRKKIYENYCLANRRNGDFDLKLNEDLFDYIYKLKDIIEDKERININLRNLIDEIKHKIQLSQMDEDITVETHKELHTILDLIKESGV